MERKKSAVKVSEKPKAKVSEKPKAKESTKVVEKETTDKKVKVSEKPLWKKLTPGTLYPFVKQMNRRVKYHEVFAATEQEIAKYRSHFELVKDGTGEYKVSKVEKPQEPAPTKEKAPKEEYFLNHVGDGKYNILSDAGKIMNEEPLSEQEAKELKISLETETTEEE